MICSERVVKKKTEGLKVNGYSLEDLLNMVDDKSGQYSPDDAAFAEDILKNMKISDLSDGIELNRCSNSQQKYNNYAWLTSASL